MSMSYILQPVPGEKTDVGQSLGPAVYAPGGFFVTLPELAVCTRVKCVRANNSAYTAVFEGTIGGPAAGQLNTVKVKVFNSVPALTHDAHNHTAIVRGPPDVPGPAPLTVNPIPAVPPVQPVLADGVGAVLPGGLGGTVQDTVVNPHAATIGTEVAPGTNLSAVTFVVEGAGF